MRIEKKPGESKIVWQQGDKFLIKDAQGIIRKVVRDREGIKRGDYLQPIGKEKDKFAKKYGWLPGEDEKLIKKFQKKNK